MGEYTLAVAVVIILVLFVILLCIIWDMTKAVYRRHGLILAFFALGIVCAFILLLSLPFAGPLACITHTNTGFWVGMAAIITAAAIVAYYGELLI